MLPTRNSAVALLVITLSLSACEFFTTKPLAPDFASPSYTEVPNALAKYAPDLPPSMYARASALGVALSTGSVAGDAMAGLRMSAAPLSPMAVNLAAVTPADWVAELGTGLPYTTEDQSAPQALPFAFSFYGQSYSSVYVSANGHISFVNSIPFKRTPWNIPDGTYILAAPAYADWMPASITGFATLTNSRVFVNTVGAAGDRRFVVTWNDIRPCCSLSWPGSSFQLQLLERTGEIRFAYREMQMVVSNVSAGIAAAANHVRTATGSAVLALQGCSITYTPNAAGYRESNSCAPEPVNVPPVVQVGGPYESVEGAAVQLSGSASDENGDALAYDWSIGDGTNIQGNPVSHSFADNGQYPATLAVSDGELVTMVTTRVDVANALPSLATFDGATRFIGEPYDVSVSLSDAGVLDAPWRYSIEWGDGSIDEAEVTSLSESIRGSHSYAQIGTYTVRVSLRDKDAGVSNSVEAQVVVKLDESDIDIKPWDAKNRIHLKGRWDKLIAVAVRGSDRLNVSTIDLATVKLERIGIRQIRNDDDDDSDDDDDDEGGSSGTTVPAVRYLATLYDVDRDGHQDLVALFDRKAMIRMGDLSKNTKALTLTGLTATGQKVVGTDPVQIVR